MNQDENRPSTSGNRCDLKLAPDCLGVSEVAMRSGGFAANTCIPCGKAFQRKFPHPYLTIIPRHERNEE